MFLMPAKTTHRDSASRAIARPCSYSGIVIAKSSYGKVLRFLYAFRSRDSKRPATVRLQQAEAIIEHYVIKWLDNKFGADKWLSEVSTPRTCNYEVRREPLIHEIPGT